MTETGAALNATDLVSAGPLAVDLFAGVGGMSLGVRAAGFRVCGAIDLDELNVETYNMNFGQDSAVAGDLSTMTGSDVRSVLGIEGDEISLLFGGPPCQGFSVGGVRSAEDPRNALLDHFARLVVELQPKVFVAENVAGLMSKKMVHHLERFAATLSAAGYRLAEPVSVLDAADYGVPQRRKRVFVFGARAGTAVPSYPEPYGARATVGDAIGDLPDVDRVETLFESDFYYGPLGEPSSYLLDLATTFPSPHPTPEDCGLSGCRRTRHSEESSARFAATSPGTADKVSRFFRLSLEGVAPTQRAGTDSSRGSYTAPRPIHPTVPRCITVREAARLHSIPDWFRFAEAKWHAFRQIGNSVPPILAKAVADSVLLSLAEERERDAA